MTNKGKLNGLDLFSGIGGIGIALNQWTITVTYCEQDRYAQGVLLSRMQSGDIDSAPIWDDVRSLTKDLLPPIDIIFGGFPCQDISVAGAGKGLGGERSGLFYEIIRLTKEIRPTFVFLENVPAIRTRGLGKVIKAFTEIGYDCRWTTLSAESVGAPHKRERWFLLAHAKSAGNRRELRKLHSADEEIKRSEMQYEKGSLESIHAGENPTSLANASGQGLSEQRTKPFGAEQKYNHACDPSWWSVEPDVGRVVNGLPDRAHRIKCLGNSVVPLQVETAFKKLIGLKND